MSVSGSIFTGMVTCVVSFEMENARPVVPPYHATNRVKHRPWIECSLFNGWMDTGIHRCDGLRIKTKWSPSIKSRLIQACLMEIYSRIITWIEQGFGLYATLMISKFFERRDQLW